jgi:hypothetical protein
MRPIPFIAMRILKYLKRIQISLTNHYPVAIYTAAVFKNPEKFLRSFSPNFRQYNITSFVFVGTALPVRATILFVIKLTICPPGLWLQLKNTL